MLEPLRPVGIFGSVRQQKYGADGKIGGFRGKLHKAVPNVSRGFDRGDGLKRILGREGASKAIDAGLESLLQTGKNAATERGESGRFTRLSVAIGNAHAARVVNNHRDNVLLRVQFADDDGRLPEKKEDKCNQRRLHSPDKPRAPSAQIGSYIAEPRADEPSQAANCHHD